MSKSITEHVSDLENNYMALYDAARAVIDNWEKGDLAGAVNDMRELLDEQDCIPEKSHA